MFRVLLLGVAVAALLVVSCPFAQATPSTLIWIPSTDIQPPRITHFGHDIYAGSGVKPLRVLGLTMGNGTLEYGVDQVITTATDGWWLNAKALLWDEKPGVPRVVVGAYNVGRKSEAAPNFVYALASKTLPAVRLHAGLCTGRKDALLVDQTHVLLGLDKQLSDKWWAAVDYQGGKSAFGAISVGVSYAFTPHASIILGYDWYNDRSLADTVTTQVDINF